MAQDNYAHLQGSHVALKGDFGPFRACPSCRSPRGIVAAGSGPHLAAVECLSCGRHLAWLSRDHLTALAAQSGRVA